MTLSSLIFKHFGCDDLQVNLGISGFHSSSSRPVLNLATLQLMNHILCKNRRGFENEKKMWANRTRVQTLCLKITEIVSHLIFKPKKIPFETFWELSEPFETFLNLSEPFETF